MDPHLGLLSLDSKSSAEVSTIKVEGPIPVERALADHNRWKGLTRWPHRHGTLPGTYHAIAGLVSNASRVVVPLVPALRRHLSGCHE